MTQLLKGIRVLDLTNVLSGPFCAYQLGLLGADVIKIEPPGTGDLARQLGADPDLNRQLMGASFLAQNGNKRSVALDLKAVEDKQAFQQLVTTSDVIVENFRPGVMKRLGLDFPALSAINPRLVYCAISGFGQEGPLATAPAYDQIIQGLSGLMSITGDPESAPLRVGYPVCDTLGGMTAAFAVCAALVSRGATGKGAFIDVSMLDSTLASMGWIVSNLLVAGQEPRPMGNENFTASPSGTFQTGAGLLNIAANKQAQFAALCDVVGAPGLKFDDRFAEREERKRNRAALKQELEERLANADAATWEARLNAAGVPAGQVLDVRAAIDQPQLHYRQLVTEIPIHLKDRRSVKLTGAGFRVNGQAVAPVRPPPALGEHTLEVLLESNGVADSTEAAA
jgi:CoA:oxalate CoA-transferase